MSNTQLYKSELKVLYDEAKNISDLHLAFNILQELNKIGFPKMELTSNKEIENAVKKKYKHPNPFDDDSLLAAAHSLAEAIEDDAPKQIIQNKLLENPFNEEPDEKVVVTTETFSRKNHMWTDSDLKTINACMDKPDNHSHRKLKYIKSRLSPTITDSAFHSQLRRMGFRIKKGRALWKN